MTKTKALKELLKYNLNKLAKNTSIGDLSINFVTVDKFMVLNKDKEVVFTDNLSNYDIDFESQKKFILNVVEGVALFVKILEDSESKYLNNLIKLAGINYVDVLGQGIIFLSDAEYIKINLEEIGLNSDDYTEQEYTRYYESLIKYFIKEIDDNLSGDNIKVVLYYDDYGKDIGIYVNGVMYEDKIHIYFKNNTNEKDNSTLHKSVTLCYSLTSVEELKKAVEIIKKLVSYSLYL